MDQHLSFQLKQFKEDGFIIIRNVFSASTVHQMIQEITGALSNPSQQQSTIRSEQGAICAARNILTLWPRVATIWHIPPLTMLLPQLLGPEYGLVRVLFFDKPPNNTWALPWHKDMTIAVRDNKLPGSHFSKPTRKAGIPHVEASEEILQEMLTARVHLDAATEENGPLKVISGSHRLGKAESQGNGDVRTILAGEGDVLLMRPLLEHSSGRSNPGTSSHRRILHLEFSGVRELPDGYVWHDYIEASSPIP
jgi:ectoine hydroxylase-related dioxygenase (phytanoyl-CoA dioxygenase family)